LFLTSTHLPEYIVAAFVKRLSRLALVGPANALLMIFAFIGNLLIRHKGLTEMITKTCTEEDDPFDFEEKDPAKTRAIESGLWEIR
jgi:U3 small nucleolar RNA-associated protein 19